VIEVRKLDKLFHTHDGPFFALREVDLSVRHGEVFGIIGRSGAGKSTLLRVLNLLERPTSGEVLLEGRAITSLDGGELRRVRQRIGMVFQHFNLLGSRTVYDNVRLPLRIAGGLSSREESQRIEEVLDLVGLLDQARKYPRQLSGGQRQRVGIARALANRPQLLLCDEATSALDPETTQSILSLLRDINTRLKLTVVLITHGMDVIRALADRVAVLDHGRARRQAHQQPDRLAGSGHGRRPRAGAAGGGIGVPLVDAEERGVLPFHPRLGRVRRRPGLGHACDYCARTHSCQLLIFNSLFIAQPLP